MTQIFATLPLNFAPMPGCPHLDSGPETESLRAEAHSRGSQLSGAGVGAAGSQQSPGSPLGPLAPCPVFWSLEARAGASPEPHNGKIVPLTQ